MNDIEILEEILNRQIEDTEGTKIMKQAIENLINRVKELETYYEDMEEVNKKFIAVDKIKEKIEEVDKYGDCEIGSPPLYKTKKGVEILKEDAELILQELLEE